METLRRKYKKVNQYEWSLRIKYQISYSYSFHLFSHGSSSSSFGSTSFFWPLPDACFFPSQPVISSFVFWVKYIHFQFSWTGERTEKSRTSRMGGQISDKAEFWFRYIPNRVVLPFYYFTYTANIYFSAVNLLDPQDLQEVVLALIQLIESLSHFSSFLGHSFHLQTASNSLIAGLQLVFVPRWFMIQKSRLNILPTK